MSFNGVQELPKSPGPTQTQPYSASAVAYAADVTQSRSVFSETDNSSAAGLYISTGSSNLQVASSSNIGLPAVNNTWYALQGILNGASSVIRLNGTENTGSAGTDPISATSTIHFGRDFFGDFWVGRAMEAGIWPSSFSATIRATMENNQRGYWGF